MDKFKLRKKEKKSVAVTDYEKMNNKGFFLQANTKSLKLQIHKRKSNKVIRCNDLNLYSVKNGFFI